MNSKEDKGGEKTDNKKKQNKMTIEMNPKISAATINVNGQKEN